MRVTVIGPRKSGKTVYVAGLLRAPYATLGTRRSLFVRQLAEDEDTELLDDQALAILSGKNPGASQFTKEYKYEIDLPGSFFGIGREFLTLTMVDPPGEDCLPPLSGRINPLVLKSAIEADGLLMIIPSEMDITYYELAERYAYFLEEVRRNKNVSKGKPLFLRIAVAMTKSDLLVRHYDSEALNKIEEMQPKAVIRELASTVLIKLIERCVVAGGDWYTLVSVFGFERNTGRIASVQIGDDWVLKQIDKRKFNQEWWPYRVFEPLEFLARGVCWREEVSIR